MKHSFEPSVYYGTFGPHEPAYRLQSGDSLETRTPD